MLLQAQTSANATYSAPLLFFTSVQSCSQLQVERLFGLVKYTDLDRNTQSTLQKLVWVLLEETHLRYVTNRGLMLAGRTTSEQQRSAAEEEAEVEALVASGKVRPAVVGIPDLTYNVGSNTVCVGDLSCTCPYSGEGAGRRVGRGHRMRGSGGRRRAGTALQSVAHTCWHQHFPSAHAQRLSFFSSALQRSGSASMCERPRGCTLSP